MLPTLKTSASCRVSLSLSIYIYIHSPTTKLKSLLERAVIAAPEFKDTSVTRSTETIAGELPTGIQGDPNKDGTYITLHVTRPAHGSVTYLDSNMPCIYFVSGTLPIMWRLFSSEPAGCSATPLTTLPMVTHGSIDVARFMAV